MIVLANDHFKYFSCPSLTHYKDNLNDIHISTYARHKSRMKNKCEEKWENQESLSINCLPFILTGVC